MQWQKLKLKKMAFLLNWQLLEPSNLLWFQTKESSYLSSMKWHSKETLSEGKLWFFYKYKKII